MQITFRGVRGSIPAPGPDTVKYGGNTTCIEVRTDADDLIILDGGTGIRQLGLELLSKCPLKCSIFITHTHWDHIQGLPFFTPLFISGNRIDFYGAFDPGYRRDLKSILSQQMDYCYFPVTENELKAEISYTTLREGQKVQIGCATVTSILLNHPILNYGYLIEADGKRLFFTGDHEPLVNANAPGDEQYQWQEALIAERRRHIIEFISGVDLVVTDAQYTHEEYIAEKVGWGHGYYQSCIKMAEEAGIPRVFLTHHDPARTDAQLDSIFTALTASGSIPERMEVNLAQENLTVRV